jgi:hypothetical protein
MLAKTRGKLETTAHLALNDWQNSDWEMIEVRSLTVLRMIARSLQDTTLSISENEAKKLESIPLRCEVVRGLEGVVAADDFLVLRKVKTANNFTGLSNIIEGIRARGQRSLTPCAEWEHPGSTRPEARFGWMVQPFGLEVE